MGEQLNYRLRRSRVREVARLGIALAVFWFCGDAISSAAAQQATSQRFGESKTGATGENARLRLIAATTAAGAEAEIGLEVELQPGWKFYWRNPGEAGLAPNFDWSGSRNLHTATVRYPAPKRILTGGFESYVYADRVILPIRIKKIQAGQPLDLKLELDYGICAELCVPQLTQLSLRLPAGKGSRTPHAADIEKFSVKVPRPAASEGIAFDIALTKDAAGRDELRIAAKLDAGAARAFAAPDLIVEGPAPYWFAAPSVSLGGTGRDAQFRVPVFGAGAGLNGQKLRLTLIEADWSVEGEASLP